MDFQTVAEKGIQWLRATVGARKGEIAAIWISPSCKEWSRAQTMNPKLKAALEVRREKEKATLAAVLRMVQDLQKEDPSVQLVVENTDQGRRVLPCHTGG
jgi:translation elongation factor EF-G